MIVQCLTSALWASAPGLHAHSTALCARRLCQPPAAARAF